MMARVAGKFQMSLTLRKPLIFPTGYQDTPEKGINEMCTEAINKHKKASLNSGHQCPAIGT